MCLQKVDVVEPPQLPLELGPLKSDHLILDVRNLFTSRTLDSHILGKHQMSRCVVKTACENGSTCLHSTHMHLKLAYHSENGWMTDGAFFLQVPFVVLCACKRDDTHQHYPNSSTNHKKSAKSRLRTLNPST